MNGAKVYPVDRLLAGYNLVLAAVWAFLLGRAACAPLLLAAHIGAAFMPRLLERAPDSQSGLSRSVRDFYPLLWVIAFWTELDFLRAYLHDLANDGPIVALEHTIFGTDLSSAWIASMPHVWLSELMHFLYFAYYPLIFVPPLALAIMGRTAALRDVILRLVVTYLACYLIYIAFPVDGPHFLTPGYEGALRDGLFYKLVHTLQDFGDSRGAAFPSSHVTAAVTIAYIGWRWFSRPVAVLLTIEAFAVAVTTVYTQNHYALDSVAGVIWALTLQSLVVPALKRWLQVSERPRQPVPVLPAYPEVLRSTGTGTMNGLTLVTGATGFIGSYLVRRLTEAGVPARVLVRCPERLDAQVAGIVDVVKGDVRDTDAVAKATQGVNTVLHLAACARAWSRDPQQFTDVNVRATEQLLEAAHRAGVERLVHVSTVLTLPPHRPAPVKQSLRRPTPYEDTKLAAERLVASYADAGGDVVIVHPTRVYGPGPLNDANGVTRVVALYIAGRFPVRMADNGVLSNYVHAADVAEGIVLAAQHGRSGAHYVLGGEENVSFRGLLDVVGDITGRRHRTVALPPAFAMAVARTAQLWARLGGSTSITPGWIRIFLEDRRVDISASRQELGYSPRPLRAGLSETIHWLRSNGR
jgi:farnesol dehydrogenase